jgi:hypothetical protein
MPTYFFTTRAPKHFVGSPDGAAAVVAWYESMGEYLMGRGDSNRTELLGNCGIDTDPIGHAVVTADCFEEAIVMAGGCPLLTRGGGIEVRELTTRTTR